MVDVPETFIKSGQSARTNNRDLLLIVVCVINTLPWKFFIIYYAIKKNQREKAKISVIEIVARHVDTHNTALFSNLLIPLV